MIAGIGTDMVDIHAISEMLTDTASHFVDVTFSANEREYCEHAKDGQRASHYAVRFAAKEAVVKALETAAAGRSEVRSQFELRHIQVVRETTGRPRLNFTGEVARIVESLDIDRAWVSLSHERNVAVAFVILERI